VLATQRLLEACVRTGVPRLVAASSSSVYGDAPAYPTTEASLTRPVSPYGVTKLAAEHLCLAYAQPAVSDMAVVTLRYFTVYGPRQRPDMAFRRFLEAAWQGRPVTVYGDGSQTRDFTYVDDAVQANLLAMTAPIRAEAVNVGGGRRVTLAEVLELVREVTGRELQVRMAPAQPGDARHTGADATRAEALLGYRPTVDLATGLAAQAAWVADRRHLAAAGRPRGVAGAPSPGGQLAARRPVGPARVPRGPATGGPPGLGGPASCTSSPTWTRAARRTTRCSASPAWTARATRSTCSQARARSSRAPAGPPTACSCSGASAAP
jgi:NAD dependent epimerase/dehydratase family